MKQCPYCHEMVKDDAKFCIRCGKALSTASPSQAKSQPQQEPEPKKTTSNNNKGSIKTIVVCSAIVAATIVVIILITHIGACDNCGNMAWLKSIDWGGKELKLCGDCFKQALWELSF